MANAPDNVFLDELMRMQGNISRADRMFQEPTAATDQPIIGDHFQPTAPTAAPTIQRSTGVTAPRTTIPPTSPPTQYSSTTAWDVYQWAHHRRTIYFVSKRCPAHGKMGPDQRKKVEMLHNCTYGYAIGVFIDGKPMKKKDVDYTLLKRQFMTAHKPAIPPPLLSTMTANVVSTCRNTAAALSAD